MNLIQITGAVELGLIYSLVAIGIFLSFRTLQFPDLTVDGSFPLGAGVSASLITLGWDPLIAIIVAMGAGALSGLVTALLSTRLKMLNLVAGIVTMTALYSINLRVMGGPNIPLLGQKTVFSEYLTFLNPLATLALITLGMLALTYGFLSTQLGLAIRATGSNARMSRANGVNDHHMIWIGISFSNALVALSGALFTQVYGIADITSGTGTIVSGLAAVIIGEAILSSRKILPALLSCLLGAITYQLTIAMALNLGDFGMRSSDRNLISAILVGAALLLPILKRK